MFPVHPLFRSLSLLLLLFFSAPLLPAQNCGCDHVLTGLSATNVNIIHASNFNYAPGDVFCVQADTIAGLRFIGFEGTPQAPLIFKNCGGKVVIDEGTYSGIDFQRSAYIHLTGTGDAQYVYGFEVMHTGNGSMGANVGYLSSDFEIDHLEIHDTGFAGIMAKTDPNCNDTMTWRRNGYVLRNLWIHDNWIYETEGEGMYLGYTGGYKVASNKVCNGDTVFGHWLEEVEINDNRLENCGWDGIQVNLVRENGHVHHNTIVNPGRADQTFQDFAMSIGGGEYRIDANFMYNESDTFPGQGIQVISGQSGTVLSNNVLVDLQGNGFFVHPRHRLDDPNEGFYFLQNTIIRPVAAGILYNSTITTDLDPGQVGTRQDDVPCYWHNNLVVNPGRDYASGSTWKDEAESYLDFNNKSTRDSLVGFISHNLLTRQMDTLGLADTLALHFRPANGASAVVDQGLHLTWADIFYDLDGVIRPQASGYDIGAYEYEVVTGIAPELPGIRVSPNPVRDVMQIHSPVPLVEIYAVDLLGRTHHFPTNHSQIDWHGMAPGIYLLTLVPETGAKVNFRILHP